MYLFTSEVVSPGHPDKCADIIADSIVDTILMQDPNGCVASEVFVAGKNIIIGGEIKSIPAKSPDGSTGWAGRRRDTPTSRSGCGGNGRRT